MLADNIGYIQPDTLAPGKVRDVAAAVESLQKQGAQKLILDLRNCSIGGPEEGIALANLFLAKGEITYLQGQKVPRKDYRSGCFQGRHQAAPSGHYQSWDGRWRGNRSRRPDGR